MTLRSVSCTSNLLAQIIGFRTCIEFLLMLTWSFQGLLQSQTLEIILICIVVLCFPHNKIGGIRMCDERMRANVLNVCRMISSTSWWHGQAWLTIKYRSYEYEPNTDIWGQFVSIVLTRLQQILFLLLWIDGRQYMELRLCVIVAMFYSPVRNIFPRISLHDFPFHRTMRKCFASDFPE